MTKIYYTTLQWQMGLTNIHVYKNGRTTCDLTSFSKVFQWGDNEKLCAMELRLHLRDYCLKRGSNSGPLDQLASAQYITEKSPLGIELQCQYVRTDNVHAR